MRSEAGLAMKRPFIRWRKFIPITGTFGRLTVIEFAGFHPKRNRSMWLVECTCGTRKVVLGNSLLSGKCQSCGCARQEAIVRRNRLGKPWSAARRAAHEALKLPKSKRH